MELGPIMLAWFVTIGALSVFEIAKGPQILQAFNPRYGIAPFAHDGGTAFPGDPRGEPPICSRIVRVVEGIEWRLREAHVSSGRDSTRATRVQESRRG